MPSFEKVVHPVDKVPVKTIKEQKEKKIVDPNPFDKKLEPNKHDIYGNYLKQKGDLSLALDNLYYEHDKDDKIKKAKYYVENADKIGLTNPQEVFNTTFLGNVSKEGKEFIDKHGQKKYDNYKYNYEQLQGVIDEYGNNKLNNDLIDTYHRRIKQVGALTNEGNTASPEQQDTQPNANVQKDNKTSSSPPIGVLEENKVSILETQHNNNDYLNTEAVEDAEDSDISVEEETDDNDRNFDSKEIEKLKEYNLGKQWEDKQPLHSKHNYDQVYEMPEHAQVKRSERLRKERVEEWEADIKAEETDKIKSRLHQVATGNLYYDANRKEMVLKEGANLKDTFAQLDSTKNELLKEYGIDMDDYNTLQQMAFNTTDDYNKENTLLKTGLFLSSPVTAGYSVLRQIDGSFSGLRKHMGGIGDILTSNDIPKEAKWIIAEVHNTQQYLKAKKFQGRLSDRQKEIINLDPDVLIENEHSLFAGAVLTESVGAAAYSAATTLFNMATVQGSLNSTQMLEEDIYALGALPEVRNANIDINDAEVQAIAKNTWIQNIKEAYREENGTTIGDEAAEHFYERWINEISSNPDVFKEEFQSMIELNNNIIDTMTKSSLHDIAQSRWGELSKSQMSQAMKMVTFAEQVGSMAVQLATTYPLGYGAAGVLGRGAVGGGKLIKNAPKVQKILNANGKVAYAYNKLGKGLSFVNSGLNPSYNYANRVLYSSKDYMPNILQSGVGMGIGASLGKALQHDYNDTYYDLLKEGRNYAMFGFFGGGLSNIFNRVGANKLAQAVGSSNKYSQNGILTSAGKAKVAKNYLLANTVGDLIGSPLSTVWEEVVTGEAGGIDKLTWEDFMFEGMFDIILGGREMPRTARTASGLGRDIKRFNRYGEKIDLKDSYANVKIPIQTYTEGKDNLSSTNPEAYTHRYTTPYENVQNIVEDYKVKNKEKYDKEDIRLKDILDATDSQILSKNEKNLLINNFGDLKINSFENDVKQRAARFDEETGEIALADNKKLYNQIDEDSIIHDNVIDAIVHEIAHKQTVDELKNNPNGQLATEIKKIADKFRDRYKNDKSFRRKINKDEGAKDVADALNLFDEDFNITELTAILSQKDSKLHKYLDIQPSKLSKIMGKKDKHREEFFNNIFSKPVERTEPVVKDATESKIENKIENKIETEETVAGMPPEADVNINDINDKLDEATREDDEFADLDPKDFDDNYDDTIDADKLDDKEHFANADYFNRKGINTSVGGAKKITEALQRFRNRHNDIEDVANATKPFSLLMRDYLIDNPDKDLNAKNFTEYLNTKTDEAQPKEIELTQQQEVILNDINDRIIEERNKHKYFDHKSEKVESDIQELANTLHYSNKEKMYKALGNEGIRNNAPLKTILGSLEQKIEDRIKYDNLQLTDSQRKKLNESALVASLSYRNLVPYRSITLEMEGDKISGIKSYDKGLKNKDNKDLPPKINNIPVFYAAMEHAVKRIIDNGQDHNYSPITRTILEELISPDNISEVSVIKDEQGNEVNFSNRYKDEQSEFLVDDLMKDGYYLIPKERGGLALYSPTLFKERQNPEVLKEVNKALFNTLVHSALKSDHAKYNTDLFKNERVKELYDQMGTAIDFDHIVKNNYNPKRISNFGLVNPDKRKDVIEKAKKIGNVEADKELIRNWAINTAKTLMTDYTSKGEEITTDTDLHSLISGFVSAAIMPGMDNYFFKKKDDKVFFKKMWTKYVNMMTNDSPMHIHTIEDFETLFPQFTTDGKIDDKKLKKLIYDPKTGTIKKRVLVIPHSLFEGNEAYTNLGELSHDGHSYVTDEQYTDIHRRMLADNDKEVTLTKSHSFQNDVDGVYAHKTQHYLTNLDNFYDGTEDAGALLQRLKDINASEIVFETSMKNKMPYKLREVPTEINNKNVVLQVNNGGEIVAAKDENGQQIKGEELNSFNEWTQQQVIAGLPPKHLFMDIDVTGPQGETLLSVAHENERFTNTVIPLFDIPAFADMNSDTWSGNNELYHKMRQIPERIFNDKVVPLVNAIQAIVTKGQTNQEDLINFLENFVDKIKNANANNEYVDTFGREGAVQRLERVIENPELLPQEINNLRIYGEGIFYNKKAIQPKRDKNTKKILRNADGSIQYYVNKDNMFTGTTAHNMLTQAVEDAAKVRVSTASFVGVPMMDKYAPERAISLEGQLEYNRVYREEIENIKPDYNAGNMTDQQFEEQKAIIHQIATKAKNDKQKDIGNKVNQLKETYYTNGGKLPDHKAPVIYISKDDYRILKQRDPNFTIGSKTLAKRTPIDSPASMLPVIVGGVIDGKGLFSIDAGIYAEFWGADHDKDAVQLLLSDKYFDEQLYDEFWNHLSDIDLNQYNNKSASDYFADLKSSYYGAGNKLTDKYALSAKQSPKVSPLLAGHSKSALNSFIQQGSAINYRNTLSAIAETGKLQEVFPQISNKTKAIEVGDKIHQVNEMDALIGILSEAGVDYSDKNPFTPAELIEDHIYEFAKKEGIEAIDPETKKPMEESPKERQIVLMQLNQRLGTHKKGSFAKKAKLDTKEDNKKYDTHPNRIYDKLAKIMPNISDIGIEYMNDINQLKADLLQNIHNDGRSGKDVFVESLKELGLEGNHPKLLSPVYLNNIFAIVQQARYKPTSVTPFAIYKQYDNRIFDKNKDNIEQENTDIKREIEESEIELSEKEEFTIATDVFGSMFINEMYDKTYSKVNDKMGGHTNNSPSIMHSNSEIRKRVLGSMYNYMAQTLGAREGSFTLRESIIDGKKHSIHMPANVGDINHYVMPTKIKEYSNQNKVETIINIKDIFDADGNIDQRMYKDIGGTTLFDIMFPAEAKSKNISMINNFRGNNIIGNKPTVLLNHNNIRKEVIADIAQKGIEEHLKLAMQLLPEGVDKNKVAKEIIGTFLFRKIGGVNAGLKHVNRSLIFNLNHNLVNPFQMIEKMGKDATYGLKPVRTLLNDNESEHNALTSFFTNKFRDRRKNRATLKNTISIFGNQEELNYFLNDYGMNIDSKRDEQIKEKIRKALDKDIKRFGIPVKETDKFYEDLLKAISPNEFYKTEQRILELETNKDNKNLTDYQSIKPVILYEVFNTLSKMSKDAKYKNWLSRAMQYRLFDSKIPRVIYEGLAQDYAHFDSDYKISANYVYSNGKIARERADVNMQQKPIDSPDELKGSTITKAIVGNPLETGYYAIDEVNRELSLRNLSGLHSRAIIKYVVPLEQINHDKDVLSSKLKDLTDQMLSISSDFSNDIKFNHLRNTLGDNYGQVLDNIVEINTLYDGIKADKDNNFFKIKDLNKQYNIGNTIELSKDLSTILESKYGIRNSHAMNEAIVYVTFKAYQNMLLNVSSSFRDKTSHLLNNLVDSELPLNDIKQDPKLHGIYGLLNKSIDNINSYINEIKNMEPNDYKKLFRERLASDKDIADIYDMVMDVTQEDSILSSEELYHEKKDAIVDKYSGLTDYNKLDNPDIIQVLHNPYVEGYMKDKTETGKIDDFDNKAKEYLNSLFNDIQVRRKNLEMQENAYYEAEEKLQDPNKLQQITNRLDNLNKFEEQLNQKIEQYGGKEQLIDEMLTDAKKYAVISAENGGIYYNILKDMHISGYERDFAELNGQERKHYDGLAKNIIKSKLDNEMSPMRTTKIHYDQASEKIYWGKDKPYRAKEIYDKIDVNDIIEKLSPNNHKHNLFESSPGILNEQANTVLKNAQINIENALRHAYRNDKSGNFIADATMNDMLSLTSGSQFIYNKDYDPAELTDESILKGTPLDIIMKNNKDDRFAESKQGRYLGIIEVKGDAVTELYNDGSIVPKSKEDNSTTEMVVFYDDVSHKGQLHLIPKSNIKSIQSGRTYSKFMPNIVERRSRKMFEEAANGIKSELQNIEFKQNEYKVRNIMGGLSIRDGKAFKPDIKKTIVHSNTVKNNIKDNIPSSLYDVKVASNQGISNWLNEMHRNTSKHIGMSLYLGLGNVGLMAGGLATGNLLAVGIGAISAATRVYYTAVLRNRLSTNAVNSKWDIGANTERYGVFRLTASMLNGFQESLSNANQKNVSQTGMTALQQLLQSSKHISTNINDVIQSDISEVRRQQTVMAKGKQGNMATARLSASNELKNYRLSKHTKLEGLRNNIQRYNNMLESGVYDGLDNLKRLIQHEVDKNKNLELKESGKHIAEGGKEVPDKIGVYDTQYGTNIANIEGLERYDFGTLFTNIAGAFGSLGGYFQEQEAHSAGTVFIKTGSMFQRLHEAKANKSVTMNDAFRASLERDMLYKTIGNYQRAAGTKSAFGRVMTMFGNFGHENFLNQTVYRKKQADLYKSIYDALHEDKDFINYLGKAGLPVGAFYLPKNNITSVMTLLSAFRVLKWLSLLGTSAIFGEDETEETEKTWNKLNYHLNKNKNITGEILQPFSPFTAGLALMDQTAAMFQQPEDDLRKQMGQINKVRYAPRQYTAGMGMGVGQSAIFNFTVTNGLMITKTAWDAMYSKKASQKDMEEFLPNMINNSMDMLNIVFGPAAYTTQFRQHIIKDYFEDKNKKKTSNKGL